MNGLLCYNSSYGAKKETHNVHRILWGCTQWKNTQDYDKVKNAVLLRTPKDLLKTLKALLRTTKDLLKTPILPEVACLRHIHPPVNKVSSHARLEGERGC
jgi:hypothetical protein